jgi:spore maturation protein CgeB
MYWGCSNIDTFFNKDGIIKFDNADDFIYISNKLTEEDYFSRKDIIESNYQLALKYVNYEQNIVNKITEIFKLNDLI